MQRREKLRKSYDKRGYNSVTVRDTENFMEREIVEREILHLECRLRSVLKPRFEMVLGAEVILPFEK